MQIDKDVQPPETVDSFISVIKEMKPGDSVFCEGDTSTATCRFYKAATQYAFRTDTSFRGRKEKNGVRVWRVE